MTLQQLQILVAVAELGSLSAAANKLHRTQSALSMALKKLEQQVGFALLTNDTYRLQLTAHGEQFLRQAQEVVKQHQRLTSLSDQLQAGAEAQLRISYDHTCDPMLLVPGLRAVQQQFFTTELLLQGETQLRVLRQVSDGKADAVICPWLPLFRQYGDFETKPIAPFHLAIVMSRKLLMANQAPPTTREVLLDVPMLIPQNQDIGINLDAILKLPGQRRIRVNDSHAQKDFLLAGMGWGVIPQHLVQRALDSGELVDIRIPGFLQNVTMEVHLVRAANRIAGPAAQLLWSTLN